MIDPVLLQVMREHMTDLAMLLGQSATRLGLNATQYGET
jgi:hypothetical protein